MGKQTDAYVSAIRAEFAGLKDAVGRIKPIQDAYGTELAATLAAYETGGKAASQQHASTLKTRAAQHDSALESAKKALVSIRAKLTSFRKFVTDKDKETMNPLAKKSISAAKEWIVKTEKVASEFDAMLTTKDSMQLAFASGAGIYY